MAETFTVMAGAPRLIIRRVAGPSDDDDLQAERAAHESGAFSDSSDERRRLSAEHPQPFGALQDRPLVFKQSSEELPLQEE